jgi:hypothetical protein
VLLSILPSIDRFSKNIAVTALRIDLSIYKRRGSINKFAGSVKMNWERHEISVAAFIARWELSGGGDIRGNHRDRGAYRVKQFPQLDQPVEYFRMALVILIPALEITGPHTHQPDLLF